MNDLAQGLYTGIMMWIEIFDFPEHVVLLVLASEHYDEGDYLRNYNM